MDSIATSVIRPFWVPGLNDISGVVAEGLRAWFCKEDYQVYAPIATGQFSVSVSSDELLLSAFASDCNRLAIAAFESISDITKSTTFPKSTGWLLIRSYYAAFFAAQSILRMLGISCSQIGSTESRSVNRVANLFGNANGVALSQGFYHCTYSSSQRTLLCQKTNSTGGFHESFWRVFDKHVQTLSHQILTANRFPGWDAQVSTQLSDLRDNLSYGGRANAGWLSWIRNEINYRHHHGTWFPYRDYQKSHHELYNPVETWRQDPCSMFLRRPSGKELQRFQITCHFLVALCRVLVEDMANRCSNGKSFHYYGSLKVLNLLLR